MDRLTTITRGTETVTFTYDDADRRATVTRPNGVVTTYGYNDADLVTELTYEHGETTLGTLSTTYDALGRPRTLSGSLARTLLPPAVASAAYDAGNRLLRWGSTSFGFDANGNVTGDGVRSYTWTPGNQLAAVSGPVPASFSYDALGRRLTKNVAGTTTWYRYDGLNLVQELQGSPTPTVTALYLSGALDEVFTRTTSTGSERRIRPAALPSLRFRPARAPRADRPRPPASSRGSGGR